MGFLYFLQFLSAFILIAVVLMHSAKTEGIGAIGSSARVFQTPKGLETGLDRITMIFAIIFIASSLLISLIV